MIQAVGVIVPAHNEESLLPACLRAISLAIAQVSVPVRVTVVADACTDRTAELARSAGADVAEIAARSVGAARAAGAAAQLAHAVGINSAGHWLATTDADTLVPAHWIARQLEYAAGGFDVVLGTVGVTRWDEHPPHVPATFRAQYAFGDGPHSHVHGANFGIRASAYLAAGGFPPLTTGEDHALRGAALGTGSRIVHAADIEVITSARRHARAEKGFSSLLNSLAQATG